MVTGGSTGIGRGCCLALAKAGYSVYATGRSVDAAWEAEINREVGGGGGRVVAVRCDHKDDAAVARLFERVAAARHLV